MKIQALIPFLPGYYWNGHCLESTGVTIAPTQHVDKSNGDVRYYVKPIGWPCGAYIRHSGLVEWIEQNHQ